MPSSPSERGERKNTKVRKGLIAFGFLFFVLLPSTFHLLPSIPSAQAASLTFISDTISSSRPSASANHTIQFTLTGTIPASGKIVVTPEAGEAGVFTIPAELDFSDVDFLTDGTNQLISSSPGNGAQSTLGVSVTSGTSGNITLTLNDTDVISAGTVITIKVGTHAIVGAQGDQQIQNPSVAGSYRIGIKTYNSSNVLIDQADTMVSIISPIQVQVAIGPLEPPPPPGGGGGGGGGAPPYIPPPAVETEVIFLGRAYPNSTITLLKDAQIVAVTQSGGNATFQINVTGLSGGNYIFSIYGEDREGRRSSLLTFSIGVTQGVVTTVSGIFIAPTIDVDKSEVKRGDNIAIFGQSVPYSEITISINSDEEIFVKTDADKDGIFLYNFDTSPLAMEQHFTKSKSAYNGEISSFSKSIGFLVGTKNIAKVTRELLKGDLNDDGRVNLIDFSIAAFWYKRPISAEFAKKEAERLSGDGKIDLVDFSIMAFYWTG